MTVIDFQKYGAILDKISLIEYTGKVTRVVGLTIESDGPEANIGDLCKIQSVSQDEAVYAEVVGFKDNKVLLMPFGNMRGIGPGSTVISEGRTLSVNVGESLV